MVAITWYQTTTDSPHTAHTHTSPRTHSTTHKHHTAHNSYTHTFISCKYIIASFPLPHSARTDMLARYVLKFKAQSSRRSS